MKMLSIAVVALVLCFAQDSPKQPNGNSHDNQGQSNTASPSPLTVNCNQSTGTVADHHEQKTPKWDTSIQWSNWALVIVAGITALVIWRQTVATRNAVLVSLKPKLLIRGIALVDRGEEGWWVDCRIANTGGSKAEITESNLTVYQLKELREGLPVFPPYDATKDWLGKRSIMPAQYEQIGLPLGASQAAFTVGFMEAVKAEGGHIISNLYCFGFIQYRDQLKVDRRTAFCMHYNINVGRFERVANQPNYDYAD